MGWNNMILGYLDPIAFHLFTKPVYWYGIIIATTVFFAYYLADREATKRGLKKDTMLDLLLIALPIAFIFARAYYVIFRWEFYKGDFASMIAIWDGGIAICSVILLCKKKRDKNYQVIRYNSAKFTSRTNARSLGELF